MKTDFNEERKTKNEELGFAPTARAKPRLSQVLPNVSAAFLKCILAFFVLNSSFFVPSAFADASDYRDMLATLELARSAKAASAAARTLEAADSAKAARRLAATAEMYASAESFADLRLWYLRNTKPKIFVEIETASNATDMGYFRLDYNAAGKLGKLRMLREEFNLK